MKRSSQAKELLITPLAQKVDIVSPGVRHVSCELQFSSYLCKKHILPGTVLVLLILLHITSQFSRAQHFFLRMLHHILIRVLQRNKTNRKYMRFFFYKELAHAVMEVNKFHGLDICKLEKPVV